MFSLRFDYFDGLHHDFMVFDFKWSEPNEEFTTLYQQSISIYIYGFHYKGCYRYRRFTDKDGLFTADYRR